MGVQETQQQTESATESPQPSGFIDSGPASYYAPEGFSDPTEGASAYADGRI